MSKRTKNQAAGESKAQDGGAAESRERQTKPTVLGRITPDGANLVGRPASTHARTRNSKQGAHGTAYVVLERMITRPFSALQVDKSFAEKRSALLHAVSRLSVLSGGDTPELRSFTTAIHEALEQYRRKKTVKRDRATLRGAFAKVKLFERLQTLQNNETQTILDNGKSEDEQIQDLIILFCHDTEDRSDNKEKALFKTLDSLKDEGNLDTENIINAAEGVGLGYGNLLKSLFNESKDYDEEKRRQFCQELLEPTTRYYNSLPGTAFKTVSEDNKVPLAHADDRLREQDAVMHLDDVCEKSDLGKLGAQRLHDMMLECEQEIMGLEKRLGTKPTGKRKLLTRGKRIDLAHALYKEQSDLASTEAAATSSQKPASRSELRAKLKALKEKRELLEQYMPPTLIRSIYSLFDYPKLITPTDGATPGDRTNDLATLKQLLGRHLYLVFNAYPEAALQYGYDISNPDETPKPLFDQVISPFLDHILDDWGILDDPADEDVETRKDIKTDINDYFIGLLQEPPPVSIHNTLEQAAASSEEDKSLTGSASEDGEASDHSDNQAAAASGSHRPQALLRGKTTASSESQTPTASTEGFSTKKHPSPINH
mgnify:CR=1 FL=1